MQADPASVPNPPLTVPVSLLDRSRTREGESAAAALQHTVDRARRAERLGFRRFWVAEHHAVPGIASGSPPILMAQIAAQTSRIRVGSGGIMLPNHSSIVVAEQARMLEALHPGRIDLGVGRSLGFTAPVRRALGVERYGPDRFAADLATLVDYLHDDGPVTAMPRGVEAPPVLVLATRSGLAVAARLGLPVVVGGPILHGDLGPLENYRRDFQPRDGQTEPEVIISLDVMIAETAEQARELLLPEAWAMAESRATGAFPPLRPDPPARLSPKQQSTIEQQVQMAVHGTTQDVLRELAALVERTGASEVLASTSTYDLDALAKADTALAALVP
jgi:luciferase family oxidoreductase group 1